MYSGDPGYSDAECQFWSQCNLDGLGTDMWYGDRTFVMSTGPFTIESSDFQQIVFGIVWARGENNFDSVQRLKKADDVVQAAFDAGFQRPAPLAAPAVTATVLDGEVILEWTDSAPSNNYLEGNAEDTPIAPEGQDLHLFEGYTVYQFESAGDQVGKVIANYDVANGVTQVIEAIPGDLSIGNGIGIR